MNNIIEQAKKTIELNKDKKIIYFYEYDEEEDEKIFYTSDINTLLWFITDTANRARLEDISFFLREGILYVEQQQIYYQILNFETLTKNDDILTPLQKLKKILKNKHNYSIFVSDKNGINIIYTCNDDKIYKFKNQNNVCRKIGVVTKNSMITTLYNFMKDKKDVGIQFNNNKIINL